jgi:hypothetical protein
MTLALGILLAILCILSLALMVVIAAASYLLYRLETTVRAAREDLKVIPALVEGITRLTQDQVRLLGELREAVDRMHAAIFAGSNTTGFTPYDEGAAAATYAKHQAKAGTVAGDQIW